MVSELSLQNEQDLEGIRDVSQKLGGSLLEKLGDGNNTQTQSQESTMEKKYIV